MNPLERLDFVLPDFTRLAWVHESARAVWTPRLRRILNAWSEIEWRSVARGVRACARVRASPAELTAAAPGWAAHGLSVMPLALEGASGLAYTSTPAPVVTGQPVLHTLALGALREVAAFRQAWDAGDHDAMGALLGYPECCRQSFVETWVDARSVDPTWAQAQRTAGAPATTTTTTTRTTLELRAAPFANVLWRWMGVRAVPHLPCRFDCAASVRLGEELRRVGVEAGFADEMAWTAEILSWPVEWSALHGIAEVKTPIVKVSTRTDATAGTLIVRLQSETYPDEGAQAVRFPYRQPARVLYTEAPSFQRGLDQVIPLQKPRPAWYHTENGFSTRHGMDVSHRPLVALAREALAGAEGSVLDLGCGNGALLEKICRGRAELVPCGVDVNAAAVEHARELLPDAAAGFVRSDLFAPSVWVHGRRHALAILMIGRLLEVSRPRADALLAAIRAHCDRLLVYAYDGYDPAGLPALAARLGLTLGEPREGRAALVTPPTTPG